MKKIIRNVYVRGIGIHGQYCTNDYIRYSKEFRKIDLFKNTVVDKVAANYFATSCTTIEGELLYWGWKFNPYSCFSLLDWQEDIPILGKISNIKRRIGIEPNVLYNFGIYPEGIKKICMGNSSVLALTNKGELLGCGSNDSVRF